MNYAIFHKLCDLIQFQVDCAKLHHCVISGLEGKVCFRDPVLIQKPAIKWKNTQLEHAGFKENILNCNANILFQSHLIQWNLNLLNKVARDQSNLFIKGEGHSKRRISLLSSIKCLYWVKLLTKVWASKEHSIPRKFVSKEA